MLSPPRRIRISEPVIEDADRARIVELLDSGWVSGYAPAVERFEAEFSRYCGVDHGIATPSGTAALHLALAALGVGAGDEVIIPTFTMMAVHHAVAQVGAVPVLCDSTPADWNIDPDAVAAAVTARTRAVLVSHTYGLACDMDGLRAVTGRHGLALIEDAAEAHGATYHGRRAGSLADVACFSFFANKIITCGEGGMLLTPDQSVARRARVLRDLGRVPGRAYRYEGIGFNYRLNAMAAALGLSQLGRIDTYLARRRRNAALYRQRLAASAGLEFAPCPADRQSSNWMVGVLVGSAWGESVTSLAGRLDRAGVDTRPFFLPVHRQPFFTGTAQFPVAEQLSETGLLLPSGNELTDNDIEYISELILGRR